MECEINEKLDDSSDNIEQITLLNRVKDLDRETTLRDQNKSSRLNFGIKEVVTPSKVITIEDSMRNVLSLGGDKNRKKRFSNGPTPDKGYLGQIAKSVAQDKPLLDKRSPLRQRNKESEINTSKVMGGKTIGEENVSEGCNTFSNDKLNIKSNISIKQPSTESSKPVLGDLATQYLSQGSSKPSLGDLSKQKMSQNPTFSLGDLATQHLSEGSSKSSLGNLATQHLTQEISKSSLGDIAMQHLFQEKTKSSLGDLATQQLSKPTAETSKSSLGDLASQHLSQEGISRLGGLPSHNSYLGSPKAPLGLLVSKPFSNKSSLPKQPPPGFGQIPSSDIGSKSSKISTFTLKPLVSSNNPSSKSLGLLADNYLASPDRKNDGLSENVKLSGGSGFTIPALFSSKTQASTSSSINLTEIDLMSALKLAGESDTVQTVIGRKSPILDETVAVDDSHIVVPDFSQIYSGVRKRKSSIFGRVISRKWARVDTFVPVKVDIHRVKFHQHSHLPSEGELEPRFQFSTSSPDDIVLKAQSQSRAFVRSQPTAVLRS